MWICIDVHLDAHILPVFQPDGNMGRAAAQVYALHYKHLATLRLYNPVNETNADRLFLTIIKEPITINYE